MKNVFEFKDYKAFLVSVQQSRRGFEKGFRSRLADHIGCQSGYISHVLNGHAHFSLEQTLKVAEFLKLAGREQKYLLLLVEYSRAGTKELKSYFENELKILKEEFLNIKGRVGDSYVMTEIEQLTYYSSWHYLAVHVLSSLPGYNNAKAIAEALKITEEVVGRILLFLIQTKILSETNGVLKQGATQMHLNRESPLIRQHHTNWRIASIQSLLNEEKNDLHYSTVSTLSMHDCEKLKAEMVQLIEKYVATVKPSPEEVMYGFNVDFYNLIKK